MVIAILGDVAISSWIAVSVIVPAAPAGDPVEGVAVIAIRPGGIIGAIAVMVAVNALVGLVTLLIAGRNEAQKGKNEAGYSLLKPLLIALIFASQKWIYYGLKLRFQNTMI